MNWFYISCNMIESAERWLAEKNSYNTLKLCRSATARRKLVSLELTICSNKYRWSGVLSHSWLKIRQTMNSSRLLLLLCAVFCSLDSVSYLSESKRWIIHVKVWRVKRKWKNPNFHFGKSFTNCSWSIHINTRGFDSKFTMIFGQ